MKITLIRHTRVAVETGICYGWSDVGVAPSFETEASRVKENISNEQFDIGYSSPLLLSRTDPRRPFKRKYLRGVGNEEMGRSHRPPS